MNSIIYIGTMLFLWAVNLFNGTGLGAAYRTTEYARYIMLFLAFLSVMGILRRERGLYVQKRYFYELLLLFLVFTVVSVWKGYGFTSLEYLSVFFLVLVLGGAKPSIEVLRLSGLLYAALGVVILGIYNYTEILSGWNPNSIAMIGLFSYLVFIVPYYGARDFRNFMILAAIGGVYCFLIWPTESRSCIMAIVFALLLSFRIISVEGLLRSPRGLVFALLVPLIVALCAAALSQSGIISDLNEWSWQNFEKPIFNGRDVTWVKGLLTLFANPLFGTGRIDAGIWHNSAVACLCAYGVIGFGLWVRLFYMILRDAAAYTEDICVIGCMSAFIVIYWQQSVELGFFAPNPDVIPYVILGILLGRVRAIKEE